MIKRIISKPAIQLLFKPFFNSSAQPLQIAAHLRQIAGELRVLADPVNRLLPVARRFGKLGEVWPRGGTSARTRLGYLYHLFEFQ